MTMHARSTLFHCLAMTTILLAVSTLAQRGEADRERRERVDDLFALMGVKPGLAVADVGSNDGFYSLRLARAVGPQGRVFAVDISADALKRLRERAEREGIQNVETVQGDATDPKLTPDSVDLVLIRNAYHEMTEYAAMLDAIRRALRPGGVLTIAEPIGEANRQRTRAEQTKSHEIAPEIVDAELKAAGFEVLDLQEKFTTSGEREAYWVMRARRP